MPVASIRDTPMYHQRRDVDVNASASGHTREKVHFWKDAFLRLHHVGALVASAAQEVGRAATIPPLASIAVAGPYAVALVSTRATNVGPLVNE